MQSLVRKYGKHPVSTDGGTLAKTNQDSVVRKRAVELFNDFHKKRL
jgi:hypothetical protein